jgi:hypothetical protein
MNRTWMEWAALRIQQELIHLRCDSRCVFKEQHEREYREAISRIIAQEYAKENTK